MAPVFKHLMVPMDVFAIECGVAIPRVIECMQMKVHEDIGFFRDWCFSWSGDPYDWCIDERRW